MRKHGLRYFFSQAVKGMWRNGAMTTASILVLMACLFVLGCFSVLVYNINVNIEAMGTLNKIVVFIDETKTEEEIENIGKEIRQLQNVDENNVERVTKEQALEDMKNTYKDSEYAEIFKEMEARGTNPFRDSFVITYQDNSEVDTLEYQLGQIEGIAKINCRSDLASSIESLKSGITFVFGAFLVILLIVSLFVIINTIRIAVYNRREEISIMRYVGATKGFITFPFVLEGIFIGIISSVLAFFIQWYTYSYVSQLIEKEYTMITTVPFSQVSVYIVAGFLIVGVVTGIIGSIISLAKYLKA